MGCAIVSRLVDHARSPFGGSRNKEQTLRRSQGHTRGQRAKHRDFRFYLRPLGCAGHRRGIVAQGRSHRQGRPGCVRHLDGILAQASDHIDASDGQCVVASGGIVPARYRHHRCADGACAVALCRPRGRRALRRHSAYRRHCDTLSTPNLATYTNKVWQKKNTRTTTNW